MNKVFLLLGSNLGDRKLYIDHAINDIEQAIAPIFSRSALYETQSWGKTDAPDFLNQVIVISTDLPPLILLDALLKIELTLGRKRLEKWGARTIDIDILFFGNDVIDTDRLTIPHPELHKRRFTLEPLNELVPEMVHPVLKKKINQLKSELSDNLHVKRINLNER